MIGTTKGTTATETGIKRPECDAVTPHPDLTEDAPMTRPRLTEIRPKPTGTNDALNGRASS